MTDSGIMDEENRLLAAIAKHLGIALVKREDGMGKTRGWDSLAQVSLLLDMEQAIGIKIPPNMFGKLITAGSIADFFREQRQAST
jgi:acyl carrier protein